MYAIIYRNIVSTMVDTDEWLIDSTYRYHWLARLRLSIGHDRMTRYASGIEARVVRTNTLRVIHN